MEERFGQYGITRRQRSIWIRIIGCCGVIGLAFVAYDVTTLIQGDVSAVAIVSTPIVVVLLWIAGWASWAVFHGSPPQTPDEERERRERQEVSRQRWSRVNLWVFTVAGPAFLIFFLVRIVFWHVGNWVGVVPSGFLGILWSSAAAFGWWRIQRAKIEPGS